MLGSMLSSPKPVVSRRLEAEDWREFGCKWPEGGLLPDVGTTEGSVTDSAHPRVLTGLRNCAPSIAAIGDKGWVALLLQRSSDARCLAYLIMQATASAST